MHALHVTCYVLQVKCKTVDRSTEMQISGQLELQAAAFTAVDLQQSG